MPSKPVRRPLFADYHGAATAFLYEILRVADALRAAQSGDGASALSGGRQCEVLRAIDRCGGAPTFADLSRLLSVSPPAARSFALSAAAAGFVEIIAAPDDRRSWQVVLTPPGRAAVEAMRMPDFAWVFTLLRGLDPAVRRDTERVLRVIRLRLERDQRQRRGAGHPDAPRR
jgi:DNA-binding MarR family transcriptional regulator